MEGDHIKINKWLLPFSWLYGLGVRLRNELFELNILKSRRFDIPVISVGNITVGGSGKTPHVEYLIRLLKDKMKVAVLSRGYKRKSRGYVLANETTSMRDIGDEPYQMKTKFPDIYVAVDKKRCDGIDRLTSDKETKDTDVILLDDAFQHRYVHPGINILLVMELYPFQQLYFTTLDYCDLEPIFYKGRNIPLTELRGKNILLISGIMSPKQLELDLNSFTGNNALTTLSFPDHHAFTAKDIYRINEVFAKMPEPKLIVTTEKDEARLMFVEKLSDEVKENIYALPIKVSFMLDKEETFNQKITSYVRKNSRNSILAKRENDHKTKDSHHSGNRPRTISFRDN